MSMLARARYSDDGARLGEGRREPLPCWKGRHPSMISITRHRLLRPCAHTRYHFEIQTNNLGHCPDSAQADENAQTPDRGLYSKTIHKLLHHAVVPPSIFISCAVMYEDARLNRNSPAALYSSGVESLPNILLFSHSARFASPFRKFSSTMGVTICPGLSELTRIPLRPHSMARLRVS
jgi:hypothetical protein